MAAGLGLLAQWLFYATGIGLNLPLAVGALLAAGWLVRSPGRRPHIRDAWVPFAALFFATFVAIRGDPTLQLLDGIAALLLAGAALATFAGLPLVDQSVTSLTRLAARMTRSAMLAAGAHLRGAQHAVPAAWSRGRVRAAIPILRGMLIALPLVLLFVALFASADAVFARIADDLVSWDLDLGEALGRGLMAAIAAWLAGGLLVFVASAEHMPGNDDAWPDRPRLGVAEAVTVLVVLDVLFAGFAALQAAYLFGGLDTLEASGLTYAQYARRGFFELLAVAGVAGGLILGLEALVTRRTRAYLVGSICLVVLTGVVLASAFLRLRLYQDAYGWTELRFYVLAAILWLAIGAGTTAVALAIDRTRWVPRAMVGLSIVFGLAFNVIGPVHHVAVQNVARALHPELVAPGGAVGLDAFYLATLGDDALVVLTEALPYLPEPMRSEASAVLDDRTRFGPDLRTPSAWQAWNLSRERARDLLLR